MSHHEEVTVKWDINKKWEEVKEVETVLFDKEKHSIPKPGVRYFMTDHGGSKQSLISEILAVCINFLFSGLVPFLMILSLIAWYSVRARLIFALSFLTLLIPVKVYDKNVLLWKVWHCLFDYFSYSVIFDGKFDQKQRYLFAEYPHGVTPIGCIVSGFCFPNFSPYVPCYSLTTGSALMIPLYGAILKWMGSVTATNANLRKALNKGSCAVVVDGIAGMYVNEPKKEMIKFSSRKGFIRAAVETGTPICPVYQFGNSRFLKLVPKWLEPYARKWKCAMGFILGRWNLPIPQKMVLMCVLGDPIPVKKVDKNDPEFENYVAEVQQKVADEIQRIYYKYRCVYGWGDRPLEIYCYPNMNSLMDCNLAKIIALSLIAIAVPIAIILVFLPAWYGRYTSNYKYYFGSLSARTAWILQECPSFIIPFIFICINVSHVKKSACGVICLSFYMFHYFYRAFIYPWRLRNGKRTPTEIFLMGLLFCLLNGYIQSVYHLQPCVYRDYSWLYDPRFFVGAVVFVIGLIINWKSDSILRSLRSDGSSGYKIPHGFMFEYVSGANYFGECVEWIGYALLCWDLAALSFAIFTIANIGPRAWQHHKWYKKEFGDMYPPERKALIPFLLFRVCKETFLYC